MPRKARKKSQQHIYHVVLRGINKAQIFYEDTDFKYFERTLNRYKRKCDFQLLAYCLMGNHIHLLIKENSKPIGDIFKHIGSSFVYWYNTKYERTGHLFQDRFKSEPVEDEAYLLTVFRYILNNPVKAGLCNNPADYPYSSAKEYLYGKPGISDQEIILGFLDRKTMKDYISQNNDDQCMDIEESIKKRCTDEKAQKLILAEFKTNPPDFDRKDRTSFNASVYRLTKAGISIRQLSRLTGISKKIIENAIKD